MNRWLLLTIAILTEVTATLSLRAALDQPAWFGVVAAGYLVAFWLLSKVLEAGMPVGVAYGVWAASGVALTAVLATFLFSDPFTTQIGLGIALVVLGVLLVETGARVPATTPTTGDPG